MITRPLFRKKLLISVSASEVKANETKKPFVRFSRVMTASNWSMSGRPALSFCLTWIGYHWSMKSKASSRLAGAEDAGNMRPSIPISPTCALLPIPPRAITAQFSNSKMRNSPKVRPRYAASRGRQTRCLKASSNENDIVLNAFCGCGTALVSSQNLGRRWIGIDISPTACRVMADRLRKDCKMLEDEKQWRLEGKRSFEDRHESTRAYIDYMRPRCVELGRVLKRTGSFYYHCDWHASHYVKVMLDQIFGENNFQNEIVWK